MSKKPVDSFDQYPVSIALYERENENGKWVNADVSKTYKDGDEYKKTRNFSMNDMLKLNALVPQAINRMQELNQSRSPLHNDDGWESLGAIKKEAQDHVSSESHGVDQSEGQTP